MTDHPNYELLQPLGTGALATVHRARDLSLQRDVAIKALKDEVRADPVRSQQLYDAAQFLAGLSHENIVQVYGLDRDRGWLVMELLPGSLAQRLARGPLPPDLVRSVLQQALKGLQALHAQKKLHGAVKPSNLLIDDNGRVKLGDSAGLSLEGELRRPEGGPKYMAPELINPEFGAVGAGVDLYSLGFTALELLKGPGFNRLFPGADAADPEMAWLRLHGSRGEPIPGASRVAPNTPPDLARVIDRMLAKDVKDRYASADEALRDLEPRELLPVDLPGAGGPTATLATGGSAFSVLVVDLPAGASEPLSGGEGSFATEQLHAAPAGRSSGRPAPPRASAGKPLLKNPVVLYSILGGVLVLAVVLVLLLMGGLGGDETVKVPISSDPAGATVFIDGKEKKHKTPFDFDLPLGKHKVRVELEGREPSPEKEIEVKKGVEPLAFTLNPRGAPPPVVGDVAVRVTADPSIAMVYVDKVQRGKAGEDIKVAPGKHTFQVRLEDYADSPPREVDVQPNLAPIDFGKLTPLPTPNKTALIHIKTNPLGVTVKLDGDKRGETGAAGLDIPLAQGKHTLELSKPGYKTLSDLEFLVKENGVEGGLPIYRLDPLPTGPGEEFKNAIGMELKRISAGTFQMGSPKTEAGRGGDEGPQHEVTISHPFYIGVTEVTQDQYQAVMKELPASPASNVGGDNPVDSVTYNQAVDYCKKLSAMPEEKAAGRVYRLPNEAEWEYACRAGQPTAYSFGDAKDDLGDYAWYADNAQGHTHPVKMKKPNAWGLYDMYGNVYEWCKDRYDPDYYQQSPAKDPPGPAGAALEQFVLRGGSVRTDPPAVRSAARFMRGAVTANAGTGFRVVCVVNTPD